MRRLSLQRRWRGWLRLTTNAADSGTFKLKGGVLPGRDETAGWREVHTHLQPSRRQPENNSEADWGKHGAQGD